MSDNYLQITPEIVRSYTKTTETFLCPLKANHYNIQFLSFRIRDMDTNKIFFQIQKEQASDEEQEILNNQELTKEEEEEWRTVRYHFGPEFFKIKTIGTQLQFSIGKKPIKNFLMIERHYFNDQIIQSYEFKFPFCIPDTVNDWESIYDVPILDEKLVQEMINSPWKTKSDSFYFVENELVMHNKAEYNYSPIDFSDDDEQNLDEHQ
ncbi:hypothetical protein IMG5_070320 [Ichthyophthirius multifiliis]|uniref:GMP phosphodiesterase delta subunit domain-containing protein n=1 Tax=Ichthyophthirius multifiliis TaxID=5932 RepID=G0QPQ4_ICHMU|nr:hypothetical protein IMG5_070320 [Ichthyophthirius multifiliis]EGR32801.1 hypothetical protein IMG5_070320 [Ichthyophthirius multifiliis]|eukprot:XP_004036787.1 hypothetical protein IMG5_070320 [Ichthyophthirius multifiliis]